MTLANQLHELDWKCAFACTQTTIELSPININPDFDILILPKEDDLYHSNKIINHWPDGCDHLIIDHYELNSEFEKNFKEWAKQIIVIDDLANRDHICDLLIDPNISHSAEDHRKYVPEYCNILTGAEFSILRASFREYRKKTIERRRANRRLSKLLINISTTDSYNITTEILKSINASNIELDIDIVLGSSAPFVGEVKKYAAKMNQNINIHLDSDNMPELIANADLAIGATGLSIWERCYLGLPSLVFIIAENQRDIANSLNQIGVIRILGEIDNIDHSEISRQINSCKEKPEVLYEMTEKMLHLVDGKGTMRIVLSLLEPVSHSDGQFTIALAQQSDCDIIFKWQSNKKTRQYSRNKQSPNLSEHIEWFNNTLIAPERFLFVISCNKVPVSVLRLDQLKNKNEFEISIFVDPEKYTNGYGSITLQYARILFPSVKLYAHVLPDNIASNKLFKKLGYQKIENNFYLNEPVLH